MSARVMDLIARLRTRIYTLISRAVVTVSDDATKLQSMRASILAKEERQDLERFQQYGLTSVPHDDAEAVVVFPAGERAHGLVIAVDDRRYRLRNLPKGEVALYTDEGDRVHLKRNREIEVVTDTFTVKAGSSTLVLNSAGLRVIAPQVDFDSS